MNKFQSRLLISAIALLTFSGAQAGEVTTTFGTGDTLTATQMTEIKDAVNDNDAKIINNISNIGVNSADITAHDSRIIDLESASPAIGRIVVPVISVTGGTASMSNGTAVLPDGETTFVYGGSFGIPSDYVSGSVTVNTVLSCGTTGGTVAYEYFFRRVNIGDNSNIFTLSCTGFGNCPTVTIPTSSSGFNAVEAPFPSSLTSLTDITIPQFSRKGLEASDTCTSPVTVYGFIIEYPRG